MEYAYIVLSFSMVITVQIAFEKIYQAVGNMLVPMVCMAAGCITNIISGSGFYFRAWAHPASGGKGGGYCYGYRPGGNPDFVSDLVFLQGYGTVPGTAEYEAYG